MFFIIDVKITIVNSNIVLTWATAMLVAQCIMVLYQWGTYIFALGCYFGLSASCFFGLGIWIAGRGFCCNQFGGG